MVFPGMGPTGFADIERFATEVPVAWRLFAEADEALADGGTDHIKALQRAVAMRPDVIFLLTDADEPRLGPGQLVKIHRTAGGIAINTVEFGYGPPSGEDNFLAQLARQNGGQYGYVDISKIVPAGK